MPTKMPPKKLPPSQQKQQGQSAPKPTKAKASTPDTKKAAIPEHEIKQNSSMSAQLALEAGKKAYDLRQAAYGAGDPKAREEILAKAVNKEIEAESFGKAAKYTRSGAFQGLAAGAGLGVQPGATLGTITGALLGGVVSSAGALLAGGVGSVVGAINGPFWDLGEMASKGVGRVVGDFPGWKATDGQKKALDKMVNGARETKAPEQGDLEQMRDDDGGRTEAESEQFTKDLTSWIPSMPSMPSASSLPSMPSIPGFGAQPKPEPSLSAGKKTAVATASKSQAPKASAKQEAPAKPQASSAKPKSQAAKSQPSQKPAETATKKKPKKLETRSAGANSQPAPPAGRKAPPKLETRNKPATKKA